MNSSHTPLYQSLYHFLSTFPSRHLPRFCGLVALLAGIPVFADFESAANAYRNKDYNRAYEQFIVLANDGDPRAQTVIGLMYKYGESVSQDLSQSYDWYMKAAEQGYAPAQFYVGEMLVEGRGVEADDEAAVDWLTRAAESGFSRANDLLSSLGAATVLDGEKVDPDVPWSNTWNFRLPNKIRYQSGDAPEVEPGAIYNVQLGAMATQAGANRLWDWLTSNAPGLFDGIEPIIKLAETDRRVYRVQAGPFDNFTEAKAFCDDVKMRIRQADCLPLKQL